MRTVRHLPAAALASLALGAATACSLLTDLEGYSSGGAAADAAPDAAGMDGGSPDAIAPESGPPRAGYRDAVLADGPVAYYRLGDDGAAAVDETGAHAGTYVGAVTHAKGAIAGDDDRAAVFDGASFVDLGDMLPFVERAPYTLEAWIAPSSSGDTQCAVARNISLGGSGSTDGYAVYTFGSPLSLSASRYIDGNEQEAAFDGFASGTFTHVVATYDGSAIALYVSGELVATRASIGRIASFSNHLTIGASRGGTTCFMRGAIDEVAVYDKALSSERVRAHHRVGIGASGD